MDAKRFPEAEQSYAKALLINPGFESALVNLGVVYEAQNNFPRAIECYRRILESHPQNHQVRSRLAYLLIMTKDLDGALQQYTYLKKRTW